MNWDKGLASNIMTLMMVVTLASLIIRRKKLGKHIWIFIAAIAVGTFIEIFNAMSIILNKFYSSVTNYVIGINLVVFLLFFIYFQNLMETKRFKRLNFVLIIFFLINYICSAIFIENFFIAYPFISYFVQVILLTGSIYLLMSQTFNSDKVLALSCYYPFWVCIGLMVIYLGITPLLVISSTASDMMNINVFLIILFAVNVMGYLILIVGTFMAKILPEDSRL